MSNHKILNRIQIEIQKDIIQCENHTIQISSISRIWSGSYVQKEAIAAIVLFTMLLGWPTDSSKIFKMVIGLGMLVAVFYCGVMGLLIKGLHIELNSGAVYTLVIGKSDFTEEVLAVFKSIMSGEELEYDYRIDFRDNTITTNLMKQAEAVAQVLEEEAPTVVLTEAMSRLKQELEQLYHHYEALEGNNHEILILIKNTMEYNQQNDQNKLKEAFGQFIGKGLISSCNQLGLFYLIEQLRGSLF